MVLCTGFAVTFHGCFICCFHSSFSQASYHARRSGLNSPISPQSMHYKHVHNCVRWESAADTSRETPQVLKPQQTGESTLLLHVLPVPLGLLCVECYHRSAYCALCCMSQFRPLRVHMRQEYCITMENDQSSFYLVPVSCASTEVRYTDNTEMYYEIISKSGCKLFIKCFSFCQAK